MKEDSYLFAALMVWLAIMTGAIFARMIGMV